MCVVCIRVSFEPATHSIILSGMADDVKVGQQIIQSKFIDAICCEQLERQLTGLYCFAIDDNFNNNVNVENSGTPNKSGKKPSIVVLQFSLLLLVLFLSLLVFKLDQNGDSNSSWFSRF